MSNPPISVRLGDAQVKLDKMANGRSRSETLRDVINKAAAPTTTRDKGPFREQGRTSTRFSYDERLRELRGRKGRLKYMEMHRNHSVVSAIFFAIEMYLRRVPCYAEAVSDKPLDREAAEFVDQCLNDMSFSFDDTLLFILVMLEQGFSLMELVYKLRRGTKPGRYGGITDPAKSQYDDGKVGWRKWAPRPWNVLKPGDEWDLDEHGGLQGANITVPAPQTIPIEYLLLFRTTPAPSNDPEGISILRSMYQAYYYSTQIAEVEGIGIERDLVGLPVVYLGTNMSTDGENSAYEMAIKLVENVRNDEQAGVVIPYPKLGMSEPGEGFLFELLSSEGSKSFNTNEVINRWDKRIAMSVLAQFIMLGMEQVGSYSLSQHQGDAFSTAIGAWASYICDTITRYALPRLFALNPSFAGLDELPRMTHSQVGIPNLVDMARFVNAMVGAMVLTPDVGLEQHVREMADLPPMTEEAELAPRTPPEEEDESESDLGELGDLDTGLWMSKGRLRYGRWLSEVAPVIANADADKRLPIFKRAISDLAFLLGKAVPKIDYGRLEDHGYDHRDGLIKSVARKLAPVVKDEDSTASDIIAEGASLFRLFDGLEKGDRQFANAVLDVED